MPKTLEEAIAAIQQLTTQMADVTKQRDEFKTKAETVLNEKKDLLKLFDDKDKEGMTDTEKKLAETLETERAERKKLEDQIKADSENRNASENDRIKKEIEARIVKASKGDTATADKLRANVSLLEKMPRATAEELDAVVTAGFNMLGTKEANPLAVINNGAGGAPNVDSKPNFADTETGKNMAGRLGLSAVAKKEGDDKK